MTPMEFEQYARTSIKAYVVYSVINAVSSIATIGCIAAAIYVLKRYWV